MKGFFTFTAIWIAGLALNDLVFHLDSTWAVAYGAALYAFTDAVATYVERKSE